MFTETDSNVATEDFLPDAIILMYCTQISHDIMTFVKRQIWPRMKSVEGLTMTDVQVLLVITRYQNRVTPSEIADKLRYDRSSITRAIKKLEKKNLVRTENNAGDLRSIDVIATEKGQEICHEYRMWFEAAFKQMDQKYSIGFTDEQRQQIFSTLQVLTRRTYMLATEKRRLDLGEFEAMNEPNVHAFKKNQS